jgi:hypothetical protein
MESTRAPPSQFGQGGVIVYVDSSPPFPATHGGPLWPMGHGAPLGLPLLDPSKTSAKVPRSFLNISYMPETILNTLCYIPGLPEQLLEPLLSYIISHSHSKCGWTLSVWDPIGFDTSGHVWNTFRYNDRCRALDNRIDPHTYHEDLNHMNFLVTVRYTSYCF